MIKQKLKTVLSDFRLYIQYGFKCLGLQNFQIQKIHLPEQKLIYIPIPKNACTSIKYQLYAIEFDSSFDEESMQQKGYRSIHEYYQKRKGAFTGIDQLKKKNNTTTIFAVIRDPVNRLISCYRNRVADLQDLELTPKKLERLGLPIDPDINTFILNLKQYREANTIIELHSRPQFQFLNGSLDYLDQIYPFEELEKCMEMLKSYKGDLKIRKKKSGGSSYNLSDLSEEALEAAIIFYKKDYQLLKQYYTPEKIKEEYRQA